MIGFCLRLAANTSLKEGPDGHFLVSHLPLRVLKVNKTLFQVFERIRDGALFTYDDHLLRVLLGLVSKGYLVLELPPELGEYPMVSIIVPVKDQPEDLGECLDSLRRIDYPADQREIIVIDDGSAIPVSTANSDIRIYRQDTSLGAAAGRNLGAQQAHGEILAFLDADCLAGEDWLRELVPFFQVAGVGAVGGFVAGYFKDSFLDRYEDACSSLNMGRRLILEDKVASTMYVPTANMLVTRAAFLNACGFEEGRRVGEDVDFCWRLRKLGYGLVYAPFGRVAHKHRNRLGRMLGRRAEYGTSEAELYRAHRDKRKTFLVSIFTGLSFLALSLAVLLPNPYPLIVIPVFFGLYIWRRSAALRKSAIRFPLQQVTASTIRSGLSFFYFAFFHLVRYYLVLILILGFLWYPAWAFAGLALLVTSIVDFFVKKPALPYPVFLFFYLLEHLAYQLGVFWGCLKTRSFGSYRLLFRRN